ncbi:cytochrome-ba3 oxidase subunit [Natrarchaeobaculum sulfurireducens]|uniref:Ba3-type terminal oxidase subunit CbaE n=1 Tax=Natrarchaeobaculum sulfurireducens TaxID=2044521 RepID=A0A346PD04_9EURY|nr:cytochrome-ba3 oxidase subunit [Natrarchaeobaculum sulfurireducens]AXR77399.1 ba3-type terminal oxidase subunit CbaE [Natrarchaeobaculum sulfurireducens]
MFEDLAPRHAAAVGLLAIVPTIIYGLGAPGLAGYVSTLNVVIIFAAIYIAMSPLEESGGSGDESAAS